MARQKAGASSVGVRTHFNIQLISTPTCDTPGTSLVLHFDNKRYIFGEFAEGTQRACIQRQVGLKKVRGLFLTGKTHWNNGGLIGMILSMASVQEQELNEDGTQRPRLDIYGGPGQMHALACARRFVFRTGMPLEVHEVAAGKHTAKQEDAIHHDENIRVWALAVQDGSTNDENSYIKDRQEDSNQRLRKEVVNNMFDSDWRRDRLFESKLKDLKLPAMVFLRDQETKALVSHAIFDLSNTSLGPETLVLHRNPWPASAVEELPSASDLPRGVAMSYIIKGHPQRGTFDVKRAKALGLNPGPKFSHLAAGQSVETDDGSGAVITPEMVLSPTRPAKGLANFDVPSVGHLHDLMRQISARSDDLLKGIETMVWMTRGEVVRAQAFQELLHGMKDVKHVISDASLCSDNITNNSSALSTSRLAQIAPSLFPIPRFNNEQAYSPLINGSDAESRALLDNPRIIPAKRGLKIQIEPSFEIDESEVAENLDAGSFSKPMEPVVQQSLPEDSSLHATINQGFTTGADLDEPEIITLGTGSAAPSKYRNVSATLLRMPNGIGNYLFDCGEGTLGQLKRLYNAEQLDEILFNLRAVWISHLHADHHLGTLSVLRATHKTVTRICGTERPIPPAPYLLSEINMMDYMEEYQPLLGLFTDVLCTPIACSAKGFPLRGLIWRGQSFDIGQNDRYIESWRTVFVSHCHGAQAVSVTFKNGFKFSYSGDCRPSEAFCEIGADSDVLVHEATFDDGMEGDAKAKKHSTTGEAVGVALRMSAKNLILTHFSQRYQKLPVISNVNMPESTSEEAMLDDVDAEMTNGANDAHDESADKPQQGLALSVSSSSWVEPEVARELPIAVAFDLMRIKVSQIKRMKALFPAISKMFEIAEEKRENAKREAVAEQIAIEEQKKQDKLAKMEDNRERKKALHREKQIEESRAKKQSKRNKRKANGAQVDNGKQTRTKPALEAEAEAEGDATTAHASSNTTTQATPGLELSFEIDSGAPAAIEVPQAGHVPEDEKLIDSGKPSNVISAAAGQQEQHGDAAIEDEESRSPTKRRRTE